MLLDGHYQNAYVTRNPDASLSDFRKPSRGPAAFSMS
jgi:hypothetical protein